MKHDIRLIAADMDGTLLNSRKELPEHFFDTVRELHKRGIRFVAASGRQYPSLRELFDPVSDILFFMCENGALLMDGDTRIFAEPLPVEKLQEPLQEALKIPTTSVLLSCMRKAYMICRSAEADSASAIYYSARECCENPLETAVKEDTILKMAVFDEEDAGKNCGFLMEKYSSEFKTTLAGKHWLDFMKPGVNKGSAIRLLMQKLNLKPENCMAFGDYMNDAEMLEAVHYGFAMENAIPELKKRVHFIAPSNDDDGVMKTIRQYVF